MILPPKNDAPCLSLLHAQAKKDATHPVFMRLASVFRDTAELRLFIRHLPFRPDLGHITDGPRVPCFPTQRMRRLPSDLNCYEATLMYLSLADARDPHTPRTSATVRLDEGHHTFPVEKDRPVLLDPISPRNALRAGLYHIAPHPLPSPIRWIQQIARDADLDRRERSRVATGLEQLTLCVTSRTPPDNPGAIAQMLRIAQRESALWGSAGHAMFSHASRQLRRYLALL